MRRLFLVFMIGLLLVLTGCEQGEAPSSTTPFLGGTTGLLINFLEDAPPQEVYDGGAFPFDIVIKLRNDGESDVLAKDAQVKISGLNPAEFGKQASGLVKHPDEDLVRTYKDAEGNLVEGTITYVSFEGFNYGGTMSGNIQFPIRADVCYKYSTKAISKLCIKKDLTDTSEDSLCIVPEEKQVFNSRAPLQVTSLKESVRGADTVGFAFKVEHMGNGDLFQQGSVCDTTGITYENKIWVEVDTGMAGVKCTGLTGGTANSGYITIYSGERTITCTQPAASEIDYEKAIEITLTYDYKEDITTQLLLKHTVE